MGRAADPDFQGALSSQSGDDGPLAYELRVATGLLASLANKFLDKGGWIPTAATPVRAAELAAAEAPRKPEELPQELVVEASDGRVELSVRGAEAGERVLAALGRAGNQGLEEEALEGIDRAVALGLARWHGERERVAEEGRPGPGKVRAGERAEEARRRAATVAKQPYYRKRVELFERYREREEERREKARMSGERIEVEVAGKGRVEGVKGWTTPLDALKEAAGEEEAKKALVAKVNGGTWDVFRPLEGSCTLESKSFEDDEGKDTYWHSSAHVLGEALELEYGADLTIGPALEEGFYYDCYLGERTLGEAGKKAVKKRMEQACKEAQPFQRIEVTKEEALDMFRENRFKQEILSELEPGERISVYRCGPMVDLCTGPHVPDTGKIRAVEVTQASRSFWRADTNREGLVRVYGVSFPDKERLAEHKRRIEEAKKRDHRVIGQQQGLFFFDAISPGSCFFYPEGARIYSALVDLVRSSQFARGYEEVVTPNVYNMALWKTSGHADHYAANMFRFQVEGSEYALKPMNCPGHCHMFSQGARSFRDLPVRWADLGVLHRNEHSGALTGLTRVRRFQQDDAHIFCRPDQMEEELTGFLGMLEEVYGVLGLDYDMVLSTRPEDAMGDVELWDEAEAALRQALDKSGRPWQLNPGDGAFYGPKIDISVRDCLNRKTQCATVQVDFQLPIRFGLAYQTSAGSSARPVIIHRAILGSVERMLAILCEHFAGKWPLWLSPRPAVAVPVSSDHAPYAQEVQRALRRLRVPAEADTSDKTLNKKVREWQLRQANYILVVGEQEASSRTVNVRTRENRVLGQFPLHLASRAIRAEMDLRLLRPSLDSLVERIRSGDPPPTDPTDPASFPGGLPPPPPPPPAHASFPAHELQQAASNGA